MFEDASGHPELKELWGHYIAQSQAIMFVIDGGVSKDQLNESIKSLKDVAAKPIAKNKPIAIVVNKKDLSEC